ncbi:MAG: hypothetical protein JWN25_2461 [Verrucomicrobiales bacterium]|nr:hypothetical protein [Verrucomicrobiales bacterium]
MNMAAPEISQPFIGLTLGLIAVTGVAFVRLLPYRRATAALMAMLAWLAMQGILAGKGFFETPHSFPPRMGLIVIPMLAFLVWVARGKLPLTFAEACPGRYLVWFQAFRILVEVTIYKLTQAGLMPREMTFEGRNFDIISGVSAVAMGFVAKKSSVWALKSIISWNLVCAAILCVTVVTGVLSAPGPQRMLMTPIPNRAVLLFPFVYIPAFMVPLAFSLHILSVRKSLAMLQKKSE